MELRRSLLNTRQHLSSSEWREKSDRICAHLQTWLLFSQAQTVLSYFSFRQEPDLSPLWELEKGRLKQGQLQKQYGFPRCVGKQLCWHLWSPIAAPLVIGQYGIPEPHPECPVVVSERVDVILVPAVSCDDRGYRLGYGGGFYDRLLGSLEWSHKIAIGITFDLGRVRELPIDPWDTRLSGVCTETGLFVVDKSC